MVTLKDIAEKANVTIATVSVALSGRGRIADSTRDRIREVANELKYQPNVAAQALKKRPVVDIGLITADILAAGADEFIHLCETYDQRSQIEMVCSKHPSFPKLLRPGYSKGILYVGDIIPEVRDFMEANPDYPIVTINETSPYCVISDYKAGVLTAFQHLVALGHRHIAVRRSNENYNQHQQIAEAVACAEDLYGIRIQTGISTLEDTPDDVYQWIGDTLDSDDPPSAFLFGGIRCVEIAIHEILIRGFRIPDDISIVALGTTESAIWIHPEISNLESNEKFSMTEAFNMLQRRIAGLEIPVRQIQLKTKFTPRASTGKRKWRIIR